MARTFYREAFELELPDAKSAEGAYVALMESAPYYGGPEEGGWWGRDTHVVAYRYFATREGADAAAAAIERQAAELSRLALDGYRNHCRETMDWLDSRGLDADFLPEPDGPSEYYVAVTDAPPEGHIGTRGYS